VVTLSGSAEAFVEAARNLYEQPALRAEFAKKGRAYAVDNFDIGRVADRFEAVFERAIAAYHAH
jgi:glycosyltransferase involved in cell wall biosynthesis